MDKAKKNKNIGLAVLITGYLTFISWLLAIFTGVNIGIGWESYTVLAFFILLMASSGILLILSVILNILESRESNYMSKGLMLTIFGFPPIAFCYVAILIKALTEGH